MMNDKDAWIRFLGSFVGVLIFSFVFGFILWSVQLRVMKVVVDDSKSEYEYVVVLLTDVEKNTDVVFQYPHAESPMYLGHILEFKKKKGFLLKTDQGIHLPRELILGKVLYQF